MYVTPEYQGNGIGNLLLENIIQEAKRMDAREIFLDSPPPFKPAYQLSLHQTFFRKNVSAG